jgi:DNA-binding NarL/FixJ family response regulator
MTPEISLVIADDHPVVRGGLRQAIERAPDLQVVAEVADGRAALAAIQELKPRIAVLDIDMPILDGFGVARALHKQRVPVDIVFLTMHSGEDLFHAAMDLGAKGYILKESALTEIVTGVRAVAAGQHFVTASLTSLLVHRRSAAQALAAREPRLGDLTPTERRVLQMVAESKSSKDIGAELFIHYRTVENHRTAICQKLGLTGPNALLKFALTHRSEL